MLEGFNEWYIDVDLEPTTQQLEDREQGISAFLERYIEKKDICDLVLLYFGLPTRDEFKKRFASEFSAIDPAFSVRYVEELALLAGAELVYLAEHSVEYNELVILLTEVAASYHKPASSLGILDRLQTLADRKRKDLRRADYGTAGLGVDDSEIQDGLKQIKEKVSKGGAWNSDMRDAMVGMLDGPLNELVEMVLACQQGLSILKEDSQILWWMTSQWSNTFHAPLRTLDQGKVCLSVGVEAAEFISNYPGPCSMQAVIYRVMEICKGKEHLISLPALLNATDDAWKAMRLSIVEEPALQALLPLYAAIVRSQNTTAEAQWYPKYMQEILGGEEFRTITPKEYAWRMYLETLTANCYNSL